MEQDQFEALLKDIARKQRAIAKSNSTLTTLIKLRDDNCPHTEWENFEYYDGGGYDYVDYSEYWSTCRCCGHTTSRIRENHGAYA